MNEIEVLYSSKTLNSGYIFFDDPVKLNMTIEALNDLHIQFVKYVLMNGNHRYYGLKMFRMKKQFFKLCVKLKEVLECS